MASPVIASVNGGQSGGNKTSHSISMPSGIQAGDLLIVLFSCNGTPTCSMSGWNQIYQQTSTGAVDITAAAFYKIAVGSDTGTVTTSASRTSSHKSMRITGHGGYAPSGGAVPGNSSNPNPPLNNPGTGNNTDLRTWIATSHTRRAAITAYPSGYSSGSQYSSGTTTTGTNTASAHLSNEATSENPGTFTDDGSSNPWVAGTIQIEGEPDIPDPDPGIILEGFEHGSDYGAEDFYPVGENGALNFVAFPRVGGSYALRCRSLGSTEDYAGLILPLKYDSEGVPVEEEVAYLSILFHFRIAAAPTTEASVVYFDNFDSQPFLGIDSSLNFQLDDATAYQMSLNTWYTIAIECDATDGEQNVTVQIWDENMTTKLGEVSDNLGVDNYPTQLFMGTVVGGVGAEDVDLYLDDIIVERDMYNFPIAQRPFSVERMRPHNVHQSYNDWSGMVTVTQLFASTAVQGSGANINPLQVDTGAVDFYQWIAVGLFTDESKLSAGPAGMIASVATGAGAAPGQRWYRSSSQSQTYDPGAFTNSAGEAYAVTLAVNGLFGYASYVSSASNTTSGTSHVATLPSDLKPGDFVILVLHFSGAFANVTPPAGWSTFSSVSHSGTLGRAIYTRRIDGTEESTATFTLDASRTGSVGMSAYRNVDSVAQYVREIPPTETNHSISSTTATHKTAFVPEQTLDGEYVERVAGFRMDAIWEVSASNTSKTCGILIDGSLYQNDAHTHATTDPQRFSQTWNENPDTAAEWTLDEVHRAHMIVENTTYASGTKRVQHILGQVALIYPKDTFADLSVERSINHSPLTELSMERDINLPTFVSEISAGRLLRTLLTADLSTLHAILKLPTADLSMERSILKEHIAEMAIERRLGVFVKQEAAFLRSIVEAPIAELSMLRTMYGGLVVAELAFQRSMIPINTAELSASRSQLQISTTELGFKRNLRIFTLSSLDVLRSMRYKAQYKLYLREIGETAWSYVGAVDRDTDPLNIDFAIPSDGDYEMKLTLQGEVWEEHTWTKQIRLKVSGGSVVASATLLPLLQNLTATQKKGNLRLRWEWQDGHGYATPADFAIWVGASSPVSTAGAPHATAEVNRPGPYYATIAHSTWVAVAARDAEGNVGPVLEAQFPAAEATPAHPPDQFAFPDLENEDGG